MYTLFPLCTFSRFFGQGYRKTMITCIHLCTALKKSSLTFARRKNFPNSKISFLKSGVSYRMNFTLFSATWNTSDSRNTFLYHMHRSVSFFLLTSVKGTANQRIQYSTYNVALIANEELSLQFWVDGYVLKWRKKKLTLSFKLFVIKK